MTLPVPCPECGYDDCAGDCTRRVTACGPCCNCGDPCEPGESICHTCFLDDWAERTRREMRLG